VPEHGGDRKPSATADYTPGDPGRVLLCCHSTSCPGHHDGAALAAALGLAERDLFDGPAPASSRTARPRPARRQAKPPAPRAAEPECRHRWGPVVVHEYRRAEVRDGRVVPGDLVNRVRRKYCQRPGCGVKDVRPERAWPVADRVLYRLPEVLSAVIEGRTVYVVEGESSADALAAAGHVATTNPFGAGKWLPEHTAALAGAARVVIVADNDRGGYDHAAIVAGELGACDPPVSVVEVVRAAVDTPKADAVDHLAAGGTVETFLATDPLVRLAELDAAAPAELDGADGTPATPPPGKPPKPRQDRPRPDGNPGCRIPVSRGAWEYALGDTGYERGVYMLGRGWELMAPLPFVHARIIRREGTGRQAATEGLVSVTEHGPRIVVGHLALRDGSWANMMGLALPDDPKVVQAASTALRQLIHDPATPEREAVPRVSPGDGRVSVPAPECLPGGYLACAPGGRADALATWAEVAGIAAELPKLAFALGASVFGPFLRELGRQSHWVELFGEPGQGKTTALAVAAGVWGDSVSQDNAVLLSWNDTAIGLGRHLGSLGILPAFLDEAGMAKFTPADWGRVIFETTQGNQRLTAEAKGSGTRRSLPWSGVLITSGNGRVTAGLGAGKYSGLVRRVLSIAAPFTDSAEQAETLTGVDDHPGLIRQCFGHLGAEVLARYSADDARRFAVVAAELTGELPTEAVARTTARSLRAGVAGAAIADEVLDTGTALRDAAAGFAREYLAVHGGSPEHDADRLVKLVREAIAREPSRWPTLAEYREHLRPRPADSFVPDELGRVRLPQRGMANTFAGVRADDDSWVAVFPQTFHAELCEPSGLDESVALGELYRRGALSVAASKRAEGKWETPVRLGVKPAGPVLMYKLTIDLTDDGDEDQADEAPPAPAPPPAETPAPAAELPPAPAAPVPAPRAATVTTPARFAAPAVVADADGAYLAVADRVEAVELPELHDLADVVAWARTLRLGVHHGPAAQPDDPVAVILPGLAARLGLPASPPEPGTKAARNHAALAPLRDAGLRVGELRSWLSPYPPGGRTVRLWLPHWDEHDTCPMWGDDGATALNLAYRLGLFAGHLGIGWRLNGGITGVDLGATFPRRRMRLVAADPPRPALIPSVELDIVWSREPMTDEAAGWMHCYDGNGAYTSAYNSRVNLGGWRHVEAPEFDPQVPGYWLVDLPEWDDRLMPSPFDPTGRDARTGRSGPRWYSTPTLTLAAELGYSVAPSEAELAAGDSGRWWEPWYERVRDARRELVDAGADPDARAVLDSLRHVWHQTHSMIGVKSQGARRDHDHTIIATYKTNLFRRLARVADTSQRWPLAIAVDNVAYFSADPDPIAACPPGIKLGTGLGEFKVKGTLPMADALPLLGTGRGADLTDRDRGLFALAAKYLDEHGRTAQ
jgi:hypothetical protein